MAALWAALWVKKPDLVVVGNRSPATLPIGWYLKRFRGAKLVVYLQDIHPDIGIALGKLRNSWPFRLLRRLMFRIYRGADRVIVLSRDMRDHMARSGVNPARIAIVPNWIDTATIRPQKQDNPFRSQNGIDGQFLVMYSGNLAPMPAAGRNRCRGRLPARAIGYPLPAGGRRLAEGPVASPGRRAWPAKPPLPPLPAQGGAFAEPERRRLHLVPLDPRVASYLMPSKLYGALASGTPLVTIAADECELADLTREEGVGVVAPPGEPEALADVIRNLADDAWDLPEMGRRARRLAETTYDRRRITARFRELLEEVEGRSEVGGQGSEVRGQKPEVGGRVSEASPLLPSPACRTRQARRG